MKPNDEIHSQMGEDGFIWWIGKVEDVENDPLKIGRVKVRIYNFHSQDNSKVSTDLLPWAHISQNPTSAASAKIGTAPVGILVGSMAWGFFLDGGHAQQPVVVGTFQGIPGGGSDLTPLATGTNTVKNEGAPDEPKSPYAAKYPFNKVTTTTSGHVIEVDDTSGAERIRIYHKSGSYDETGPDGTKVDKSAKDRYIIVDKDMTVHVVGNVNLTVDGNTGAQLNGTLTANVKGKTTITTGSTIDVTAAGTITVNAPNVVING